MRRIDRAIARVTAERLAFSTREAALAGVSSDALAGRAEIGQLRRPFRGAYVDAGQDDPMADLWAAWVAAGPRAVVTHRSAAVVWGMRGVEAQVPELSVPYNGARTRPGVIVHFTDALAPPDVVTLTNGLVVTSPAKTLLDLGAVVRADVVESAAHDVLHRELARYEQLTDTLERLGGSGRRGTAAMRRFLRDNPGDSAALESELEVRFERLRRRFKLPVPQRQHAVRVNGKQYRIDFAYLPSLGIEVLGAAWHTEWNAVRSDLKRRRAIVSTGIELLEFTWREVTREAADVAREIRQALRVRSLAS